MITAEQIEELRGSTLHCGFSDIFKRKEEGPPPELVQTVTEYLARFAPPADNCLVCKATLGGLLGSFSWGIVHGEGFCSQCNWPARAYHEIKDDEPEALAKFSLVLQYHPDGISVP